MGVLTETFICVDKKSDSVLHSLSTRKMLYLGVQGGMPPREKFCKFGLLRLNLIVILSEKYIHDVTLFM